MPVHKMTLRGPWELQWLKPTNPTDGSDSAETLRVKMPSDWQSQFGDKAGTVSFKRHFHKPTNLDDNESVFVVLTGFGGNGVASLNGESLGQITDTGDPVEFEVIQRLKPGNQLGLELEFDPGSAGNSPGGLWGPVVLEIRSTD